MSHKLQSPEMKNDETPFLAGNPHGHCITANFRCKLGAIPAIAMHGNIRIHGFDANMFSFCEHKQVYSKDHKL